MPFFQNDEWLSHSSKLWVWVALTVPSTGLVFSFYVYSIYRDRKIASTHLALDAAELQSFINAP